MIKNLSDKQIIAPFIIFAIFQVALAIIGGVHHYSPVPFVDMWDGQMPFLANTRDWHTWWAQHNEHRIFLSRILFLMDFKFFSSNAIFLFFCNYLFAFMSFIIFFMALKEMLKNEKNTITLPIMASILLCLLFFWDQKENFTWAFQSQFFLASSLPLLAFYSLHKSYTSSQVYWFILACFVGLLSSGAMANGILASPIMVLLAITLRMKWPYIVILLLLASFELFFYFNGYTKPSQETSMIEDILKNPIGLIRYSLVYLSNPFASIVHSKKIFFLISSLFLFSSSMCLYRALKSCTTSSLQLALLAFILYVVATAMVTSGGRSFLGTSQALSSRYATPTLMMWSALFILYAPWFAEQARKNKYRLLALLIIPVVLFPYQIKALSSQKAKVADKMIAALALAMHIQDDEIIISIYPFPGHVINSSKDPAKKNIAIFNNPLIKGASHLIGQKEKNVSNRICEGEVTNIIYLEHAPEYVRIEGTLSYETQSPKVIHILSQDRTIVGYALGGAPSAKNQSFKFKGYLKHEYQHQPIILKGLNPDCEKGIN